MKINIKKLILENFGKFIGEKKEVQFGHRTQIKGRNGSGKTTIGDAFSWIFTNKLMNGDQADGIRPHEDGKDIDYIDIVASVELDMDGREVEIQKTQSQDWVKKTGVFKGNSNTYLVNGIPKKEKEFGTFLSEILPVDALPFCMNASAFLKLDSKKRRQELFKIVPEFTDETVIASDSRFEPVRTMLRDGMIDELITRAKYQLKGRGRGDKGLEGQRDDIHVRIDEASKQIRDVAEFELAIKGLDERLSEIDRQEQALNSSLKTYEALDDEIISMRARLGEVVVCAGAGLRNQKAELNRKISDFDIRNKSLANDLRMAEMDLRHAEMGIQRHEADLKKAQENYMACSARKFDETKLHEIEAEQFDENSIICPECGQVRPEGQQENLRETFEKSKKRRIAEQEKAREVFDADTEKILAGITECGNKAASDLKTAQADKTEAEQKISEIKKQILSVSAEIERLSGELAKIPQEVDLSCNEEYQNLSAQIAEKEKALAALDNGSSQRTGLQRQRTAIISEKAEYQQKIKASHDAQDRVDALKEERKEIVQKIADINRDLDLLRDFNKKKCEMLTAEVNKLFRFTKWELFKWNIDGEGYQEICEPTFNGIQYGKRLNKGARGLINVDICATFQKAYGVSFPVFIDDSEGMTSNTMQMLDDFEQQIIFLTASECDLTVTQL